MTPVARDPTSDAVVREAARGGDLDRYLAALLAPPAARPDLLALTAFVGEVARIPRVVTEPMMGEIRLQWWRDALSGERRGDSTGSPVADALEAAVARHHLPREEVQSIINARSRELEPQSLAGEADLETYLRESDGAAFALAARILGGSGAGVDALTAAAGQAYGRARFLLALPSLARHRPLAGAPGSDSGGGFGPILNQARDRLAEARRLAAGVPRGVLPALLPLALVEPYLAALEGQGPDIARVRADISPLTRVWRLWWASVLGRF